MLRWAPSHEGDLALGIAQPRYLPLMRLGTGVSADVYFGVLQGALGFRRPVVLKRALPSGLAGDTDTRRLLAEEAHVGAALGHPNVVHVYELVDTAEGLVLAMEYLAGLSLMAVLSQLERTEGTMPAAIAARIGADAARGLYHAHCARGLDGKPLGIVHRDVSPKNILVTEDGVTKVADFGIARSALRPVTRIGPVKGTLGYLSPEQARGEPLDWRSDVFSLGVVLHELLSVRPLFERGDLQSTMAAIVSEPIPPPPPYTPPVMADLIRRMLVRPAEQRSVHLGEVADLLETLAVTSGGTHRDTAAFLRAECGSHLDRRRVRVQQLLAGAAAGPPLRAGGEVTATLLILEAGLDEDLSDEHPRLDADPGPGDTLVDPQDDFE